MLGKACNSLRENSSPAALLLLNKIHMIKLLLHRIKDVYTSICLVGHAIVLKRLNSLTRSLLLAHGLLDASLLFCLEVFAFF